jgi:hybrid cluster-associated redox disulfide protein
LINEKYCTIERKNMNETNEIIKNWTITKLVNKYPETVCVLLKYNLHCTDCAGKECITIKDKAIACNINLENLLKDLNQKIHQTNALY